MYVSPRAHDDYLRAYERALLRDARRHRGRASPAADLAIQWDICQEVLVFESYFPSRPADYKERIFALLARLGDAVPAGVELGYHLCYGSPADQHLVMPKRHARSSPSSPAPSSPRVQAPRRLPPPAGAARARRRRLLRAAARPALPAAHCASTWACIHHDDRAGDRRRIDVARDAVGAASGWPPSAAGAAASPRGSPACSRATATRWTTW